MAYSGCIFIRKFLKSPLESNSNTIITCVIELIKSSNFEISHRLSHSDHTHQLDDIGVSELTHNGCLLEELDLVYFICTLVSLHCHLNTSSWTLPNTFTHSTKCTTAKKLCDPVEKHALILLCLRGAYIRIHPVKIVEVNQCCLFKVSCCIQDFLIMNTCKFVVYKKV